MRAICLHASGLSLVCVDSTFYPDGTRIEALTFSDNIAVLSHSWDFISQPNTSEVCMCGDVLTRLSSPSHDAVCLSQHLLLGVVCRACVCASVSEHNLQSLNMCSFEFLSLSLSFCPVLSACLLVVWCKMAHYGP